MRPLAFHGPLLNLRVVSKKGLMSDSVPPSPDQVFVSVSQAARLNGVSERAIRKRCASGKIPYAYRNNLGHWRLPMLVRRAEVTMKVAAEWAQVDPKTVRRWCQQSKIPGAFQRLYPGFAT